MELMAMLLDPLLALAPVIVFLLVLLYCDSFKLVGVQEVVVAILAGVGAALAAYWINPVVLSALRWDYTTFIRYGSPPIEESIKALPLAWLLLRNRIGFPVDAAIYGFAAGTGFAVIENVYYLHENPGAHATVWLTRGLGTALLHGGASGVFTILARLGADRSPNSMLAAVGPAWLAAVVIHSFYNHFFLSPLASALLVLLTLPLLVASVFAYSERLLQRWLAEGFDAHTDMLALLDSGDFRKSRAGQYLDRLQNRFTGEIVGDMLCYLRLHTELSLRAKGVLIMREQGFKPPRDPETADKLNELTYLSETIGTTGMLALLPILGDRRNLWQLFLLEKQ